MNDKSIYMCTYLQIYIKQDINIITKYDILYSDDADADADADNHDV